MSRRDVWFLGLASGASVTNAFSAGVAYAQDDWWGLSATLVLVAALGVGLLARLRHLRALDDAPEPGQTGSHG